jgi:hypothetical protein
MPRTRQSNAGTNAVEAEARAINATAWEPPPGMVKVLCQQCSYWFSASDHNMPFCADCAAPPRLVDPGDERQS